MVPCYMNILSWLNNLLQHLDTLIDIPTMSYPREKPHPLLTSLAVTYPPSATFTHVQNQECFILAAAFQATFQDAPHPITPDQVPIIIDSGASITISPCHLDFMNGIKPVQPA